MTIGIPDSGFPDTECIKNGPFRTYSHSTGKWYGIPHEKNGADNNTVCAILYFPNLFVFFRRTW